MFKGYESSEIALKENIKDTVFFSLLEVSTNANTMYTTHAFSLLSECMFTSPILFRLHEYIHVYTVSKVLHVMTGSNL